MAGKTKIVETGKETSILIDADTGTLAVGAKGVAGTVEVIADGRVLGSLRAEPQAPTDRRQPRVDPSGGVLELSRPGGDARMIVLDGGTGTARAPSFVATGDEGRAGLHIDGDEPSIDIGGEKRGRFRVRDSAGHIAVSIDPSYMKLGVPQEERSNSNLISGYGIYVYNNSGQASAFLDGVGGRFLLGEPHDGGRKIELDSRQGLVKLGLPAHQGIFDRPIELEGDTGVVTAGCPGQAGEIRIKDAAGQLTIKLEGATGALRLGAQGSDGDLIVLDQHGREAFRLDGATATITLGANGVSGDIVIKDLAGRNVFHIDGKSGAMRLGTAGDGGDFVVTDDGGRHVCHVDGQSAGMRLGTNGNGGAFAVDDGAGRDAVRIDGDAAQLSVGSGGHAGQVTVRDADGADTIRLDGNSGDILLSNADCAEEFDFATAKVQPGSVVVIGDDEQLSLSSLAYDTRVAGVVSGAGRYRPALVLDRRRDRVRPAVAMVGKVECLVDAGYGPVRCGDLLVSSPTPGYAMAAGDRLRAAGAVLGKALRGMDTGQGLIPILVCLQ